MFAPESDPNDLRAMGWCLIAPPDLDPAARDALRPLIEIRRQQAEPLFREALYRPGESASMFLSRHGIGSGPPEPSRLPYYLLLAGAPHQIPFEFQQQLAIRFAVGRLHFHEIEPYARYAESVVAAESSGVPQARRLALFAPRHDGDPHTAVLAQLVSELSDETLRESDWQTSALIGTEARKAALMELLVRTPAPAILLAAAHAVLPAQGAPERQALHGALVCQDWPGLGAPVAPEAMFAAPDVPPFASVHGMVGILWGSHTAGYVKEATGSGTLRPGSPDGGTFVSALGQRLLSAGHGTAFGVIGLAGRMFGSSLGVGTPSPGQAMRLAIRAMTKGDRIGQAMRVFGDTVAALSAELSDTFEQLSLGREIDVMRLDHLWSTTMDMRRVVLLGDPAARLPAALAGRTS